VTKKSADRNHPAEFTLGGWRVVPLSNSIERAGQIVKLQKLSMDVLLYLADRPGAVVTYDDLLEALWPGTFAGEDAVHRRVADLRRKLGDDARSPNYIETISKRGYRLIASVDRPAGTPRQPPRSTALFVSITAAILVLALTFTQLWKNEQAAPGADATRTRVVQERVQIDLMSSPPGAEVAYKPYGNADAAWQPLGITPIRSTLPEGVWILRLMADGREAIELAVPNPGMEFNNLDLPPYTVELPPAGSVPAGMVYVPSIDRRVPLWGYTPRRDIGEYFIGRTEVSNAEFAEFVTANGYRDPSYWRDLLESEVALPFEKVAARFTDSTGKPGPAGWIDGDYRTGTADLPVAGVSWYEAMAYARFRGVTLPAAPHWARAALGVAELEIPFAPTLLRAAHLDGSGPIPAADSRALSTFGAVNLVGNVREWVRSYSGNKKLTLGASFAGPVWAYAMPTMADPLTRLPTQGFRLAKYDEASYQLQLRPLALNGRLPKLPEVTDDDYAAILSELSYEEGTLDFGDVKTLSDVDDGDWIRRKISIPTSDAEDPLPVILFFPKDARKPLQPVLYLTPGSRAQNSLPSDETDIRRYQLDFIIDSGRALVWPILAGTHERYTGEIQRASTRQEAGRLRRKEILRNRQETGRLVDYLVEDPGFSGDQIGLLAASSGVSYRAPQILAAERRIRAAVFLAGSLAPFEPDRVPLLRNPNTYWPRLSLPIFVAHGRYDIAASFAPPGTIGGTLFEVIGTPPSNKRLEVYEMAHWPFPPLLLAEDLLPWLDEYLGPVD